MDALARPAQDCAPMEEKPGKPAKSKVLSAHQAGIPAPRRQVRYKADAPGAPAAGLTVREEELLSLVGADASNKEIGKKLRISVATVEKHLENIYPKIGAKSRASAAIWVLKRQLEQRDREILILKELLAKGGASSAPETS